MNKLEPAYNEHDFQLLQQLEHLAKVGIWEVSLNDSALYWSTGVYAIYELNPDLFSPTLENAIQFFTPDSIPTITECVNALMKEGKEYDEELQIITSTGRRIWVRAIGKAVFNSAGEISKVHGLFQDIDNAKNREIAYHIHKKKVEAQNMRLQQFAHIVSHNLRSYTGNLELMLKMIQETTDQEERESYWEQINKVSSSLNETIASLSEVVRIESEGRIKRVVRVQEAVEKVVFTLQSSLQASGAELKLVFGDWEELDFEPAYFDSILLNLMSNSIKYRDPERPLIISLSTSLINGKKRLLLSDNGLGIDLKRYGVSVFGLYKTFHGNKDARGIGLFITKSQVESMGGKIWVESEPNEGAAFHIEFQ